MKGQEVVNSLELLESSGYYIQNLWHIEDVKKRLPDLSDDEALGVLDEVLTSDEIFEAIHDKIDRVVEEIYGQAGKDVL